MRVAETAEAQKFNKVTDESMWVTVRDQERIEKRAIKMLEI
jgi:hypothetical protein